MNDNPSTEVNEDYVPDPGWRVCEGCQVPKKLEGKNFGKTKDGYEYVCKACRKKYLAQQKLERMETNACLSFVDQVNTQKAGTNLPHISEMLESVMDLFGGSSGFAAQLVRQYYAAPAGGRIRTTILEMVMKLTDKVAESGATRAPAALMSDEELEAALEERMQTAVISYKGQKVLGVQAVPDEKKLA